MPTPHPISCKLSDPELREPLDVLRTGLFARTRSVQQGDEHITFAFAATGEVINSLMEFIVLERECCPFLRLGLDILPEPGEVRLILSGEHMTRTFIQQTFVSLVPTESTSS